jgi:hypothetical protein
MRHPTTRIVIGIAALVCFAGGTAIGVGLQQGSQSSTSAFEDSTLPSRSGLDAETAPGAPTADPGDVADGGDAAAADALNDEAGGRADRDGDNGANNDGRNGDEAGEQAPPEGEERPPPRNQPQIPDLELVPGVLEPPRFLPPAGNGNGDQPPPPPPPPVAQPLAIHVVALGPGPIWENGWQRRCEGSAMRTSTFVTVSVFEVPDAGPYRVTATARAGAANRNASVQQEPGQARRFTVAYGFPRGSVARPEHIEVTVTVTDANGNRATVRVGGRPGTGHRLYPADYCS